MDNPTRKVRQYHKLAQVPIPQIPAYVQSFPPESSSLRSPIELRDGERERLRPQDTRNSEIKALHAKMKPMEEITKDPIFETVGDFLAVLFYNPSRATGETDPRSTSHRLTVSRFLSGQMKITISHILDLVYSHKHSAPSTGSPHYSERHKPYILDRTAAQVHYARAEALTWSVNLVGSHVNKEIYVLTRKNSGNHLSASTNGRQGSSSRNKKLITWEDIGSFSLSRLSEKFKTEAPISWFMTESMAASKKNGVFVVKKRRPHPVVQVGAISSFILTRKWLANGDLALVLGIWHFAAKSHIDVKRVYSRFGNTVSDNTVRNALNSMAGSSLAMLQASVNDATNCGETAWCVVLDNVQDTKVDVRTFV